MILKIGDTYVHLLELPLLFFLLGAAMVHLARNGFRLRVTNVALPLVLFISLALYVCAIALSAWNALDASLVAKSALKWLEVLLLVGLVFLYVETGAHFAFIYWTLALSAALAVIHTVALVIAGRIPLLGYRVFPGPEALFALVLAFPFVGAGSRWTKVLTGLCLLSAILSMSRVVWLALLLFLLLARAYHFLPSKNLRLLLCTAGGILLVLYVANRTLLLYRWSELFAPGHVSNVVRWMLLRSALDMFLRHPLVGVGSANFLLNVRQQGPSLAVFLPDKNLLEPHNAFLRVLAEEGAIGFCFFSLSLVATILLVRSSFHSSGVSLLYKRGLSAFLLVMGIYLLFGFIAAQFRFFLALGYGLAAATVRVLPASAGAQEGSGNG
ncbi:MAG: O-antigen ligase family protein [Candidatus Oleimicrobiaceae bacterium]